MSSQKKTGEGPARIGNGYGGRERERVWWMGMDTASMIRGGGRGRQGEASDVVGGASCESGCTAKEDEGNSLQERKRFVLP